MGKNTRTILQPRLRPGWSGDAEMPRLPRRGDKWRLFPEAVGSLGGVLLLGVFSSYCAPLIRGLEGGLSGWVLLWMLSPRPPEKSLPAAPAGRLRCLLPRLLWPSACPARQGVSGYRREESLPVSGFKSCLSKRGLLFNYLYSAAHPWPCLAPQ